MRVAGVAGRDTLHLQGEPLTPPPLPGRGAKQAQSKWPQSLKLMERPDGGGKRFNAVSSVELDPSLSNSKAQSINIQTSADFRQF